MAIPGKYADRTETAEYLRQMAHAVNGRFHWYRSGGVYSLLYHAIENTANWNAGKPLYI